MSCNTMYRPTITLVALLLLGCLIHSEATAQRVRMSPEERTMQLTEQLKLTEAQAESVSVVLKIADEERMKALDSLDGNFRSLREVMTRLHDKNNLEIEKLLTEDQRKAFKKIQKEAQSRQRPGRRGWRE